MSVYWCWCVCMYVCIGVCLCVYVSHDGVSWINKPGYYYYSLKSEMCLNCILCFVLPMFNLLFQNRIFVNWLHWDRIKFVIIKIKLLFNEEYVLGHFHSIWKQITYHLCCDWRRGWCIEWWFFTHQILSISG